MVRERTADVAMGDLAYALAALADLDRECGTVSGFTLLNYSGGELVDGYHLRVASAYTEPGGESVVAEADLLLVTTSADAVLQALADGVERHRTLVLRALRPVPPLEAERGA